MKKKIASKEQRITDIDKEIKEIKQAILVEIGERIKYYREEKEYSQENLVGDVNNSGIITKRYNDIHENNSKADRAICEVNYSVNSLSRHEHGSMEMGIITFINICRGLEKTPNELLADYFENSETLKPEIMDLYEQLTRANRFSLISYAKWLLSDQGDEDKITKF